MENNDLFSVAIQNFFNSGLSKGTLPKELKRRGYKLALQKGDALMK